MNPLERVQFQAAPAPVEAKPSIAFGAVQKNDPKPRSEMANQAVGPKLEEPPHDTEPISFVEEESGSMIVKDEPEASGSIIVKDEPEASGSLIVKDEAESSGSVQIKDEPKESESDYQKMLKKAQEGNLQLDAPTREEPNAVAPKPLKADEILEQMAAQEEKIANPQNELTLLDKIGLVNPKEHRQHALMIENGSIYGEIKNRENEIEAAKQKLKPVIADRKRTPVDLRTRLLQNEVAKGTAVIRAASGGQGGAYFGTGVVIKPKGESIGEVNNAKGNAFVTISPDTRVRDTIPTYQENEREAAGYEVAVHAGLQDITPPTILAIVKNEGFSDLSTRLNPEEKARFLQHVGPPNKEKLCTIQKMIPNATTFETTRENWEVELREKKDAQNEKCTLDDWKDFFAAKCDQIDFRDFEGCSTLCWLTGENDGNQGNFMLYSKDNGKLGMMKIDNGLAFPEKNQDFVNNLAQTPLGAKQMSKEAKELIRKMDPDRICSSLQAYGLNNTIAATRVRIRVMQRLVHEFPTITHREMNLRLGKLYLGEEACFKNLTGPEKLSMKGAELSERRAVNSRISDLRGNFVEKEMEKPVPKGKASRLEAKPLVSDANLVERGRVRARIQELNGEQKP